MAIGLAAGIKSTDLIAVPFVVELAVIRYRSSVAPAAPPKRSLRRLYPWLSVGIPVLAFGSFWYLRDWVTYGDPVYPVSLLWFHGMGSITKVVLGGQKPVALGHGGWLVTTLKSWSYDLHLHPSYTYDIRLGGFGLWWPLLGLPAILGLVIVLIHRRDSLHLFGLVFPIVVLVGLDQATWWARYSLPIAGLGAVAVVVVAEELRASSAHVKLALLGRALPVACVTLAVISMWWATDPTQVLELGTAGWVKATPAQAVDLMETRSRNIWPWAAYQIYYKVVPPGSTTAVVADDLQPFTFPLVGENLSRQLVVVGSPTKAAQLASMMDKAHAQYVALDETSAGYALRKAVLADPEQFQALTSGDPVEGADIFHLGHWAPCQPPALNLSGPAVSGDDLVFTAEVGGGCGTVSGQDIELWQAPQGQAKWLPTSKVLTAAATNQDGTVLLEIPRSELEPGGTLWVHTQPNWDGGIYRLSASSGGIVLPTED
jgi:hypothetical protein